MQIAWIRMRRRVIQIGAVWHSDNIFTNFERHWSTLKIEADEVRTVPMLSTMAFINVYIFNLTIHTNELPMASVIHYRLTRHKFGQSIYTVNRPFYRKRNIFIPICSEHLQQERLLKSTRSVRKSELVLYIETDAVFVGMVDQFAISVRRYTEPVSQPWRFKVKVTFEVFDFLPQWLPSNYFSANLKFSFVTTFTFNILKSFRK